MRWLLRLILVIGVLLTLVSAAAWIDTHRNAKHPYRSVFWRRGLIGRPPFVKRDWQAQWQNGRLRLTLTESGDTQNNKGWYFESSGTMGGIAPLGGVHTFAGVKWARYTAHFFDEAPSPLVTQIDFSLPELLLIGLALAAGANVVLVLLRRNRAEYACRRCGYDLRASSERCPECGMAIKRSRRKPQVA